MAKAAGIYTRISDDRAGNHLGVERQREDCQALAQKLGWPISAYYEDNDLSAYSGKPRPQYRRMLEDLRNGQIDAIAAWHPDRLYRSPRDLEELIDLIETSGASIQTVTAGDLNLATPTGRVFARTVGAFARYESEHKAERIRRQQEQLALTGRPSGGGTRPFGYERDQVTIVSSEAAVIREMKDRILAGDSLRSLATDLNLRGCRTSTGREWYPSVLRDLLLRPRYSGQREYRGEVVAQATWPAIISVSETASLAALLRNPSRRTNRTSRRYLLSGGLLRCATCHRPLVARPRGDGARRYVCAKGPGLPGCGGTFILADTLETFVIAAVLERLDSPQLAAALTRSQVSDERSAMAQREAADADAQLAELAAAWGARTITFREWQAARTPIEQRAKAARAALAHDSRLAAAGAFVGNSQRLRAAWETLTLSRQHAIVSAVLEFIEVGPGRRGRNRFDPDRLAPAWRA
jgi:site-specific DNA recombinase